MSIEESLAEKAAVLVSKSEQRRASRTPPWTPPSVDDIGEGTVLAFDQTFSKTGWVLLSGPLTVIRKGYLYEPPIPDSLRFFDVLQRTDWMGDRIRQVVLDVYEEYGAGGFDVVHEMPILQGMRVESSLLGATKVWEACKYLALPTPTILSKTRVAGLLCPPGDRKGKSAITRGLAALIDTSKGWNEHNRDALALAITFLHDKKRDAEA